MTSRGKIYESLIETTGSTPLVRLKRLEHFMQSNATLLAKIESFNPLSSIKDRLARAMVEDAESKGHIKSGFTLVEPTSGNTGIGLAFIAAIKGYKLILTMPETMSAERRKLLAFLGAQIVLTKGEDGMQGAIDKAHEIVAQTENAFMLRQFENPVGPRIHYEATAKEIWDDAGGKVDAAIIGVGTGGTIEGVSAYLKEKNPAIQIIAVEPKSSPVLSGGKAGAHGIQGIGANFFPPLVNKTKLDEIIAISEEEALHAARLLAQKEGILAGISAGAAMAAGFLVARRPEMEGKTLVIILPDTGERYLSTPLFDLDIAL
ncbi:MAG: cysteine synthase A [Alphaproteobacteria bacterium]|nr:cysteine synthase A [Alphaproteobacteria bacterium]